MCMDHRCLAACQKQHRQNDPGGQVDIPAIEVICIGKTRG